MPRHPAPLITLAAAWDAIVSEVRPGEIELRPLDEAHGRILAESVRLAVDYPPFDKAMMDGFAVRAEDVAAAPVELAVIGSVNAGRPTDRVVRSGEAMRINTGAPLPPGADAVVPVEHTDGAADGRSVRIRQAVPRGKHVSPRGSDRRAAEVAVEAGGRLAAAQIAALATAGAARVKVYRRPSVAILVTGDELSPVGSTLPSGAIFDSNGPALAALTRECGGDVALVATVRDDPGDLRRRLVEALDHPLTVTVGGMSMGTRDLVPEACADLGVRWKFHGVSIRPGKPVAYGVGPAGQHVFGLPGNPVSCYVCFLLFVRMVLDGLQGLSIRPPRFWRARTRAPVAASKDPRPAFLPARLLPDDQGGLAVQTVEWRGSSDAFAPARANALLAHCPGDVDLPVGSPVDVLPLPGCLS